MAVKLFLMRAALLVACAVCTAVHAQTDARNTLMAERAFEGAQWIMATKAARAVAQMGARAAQGDGPLALLIRQKQQLEADLTRARSQYAAQDAGINRQQLEILDQTLLDMDAEIRAQFPGYAEFANPKPIGYAALRAQLAPNEGLVMFLSAPFATYVWAVSHQGQAWHRADITAAQLSERIRLLRQDLDPTAPVRAAVALSAPEPPRGPNFDDAQAHALFADLLAPVMSALADADHLFVVKDGALAGLPLAVLQTEPPGAASPPAWLIRRFALTTLPAVSSLGSIRAASRMAKESSQTARFVGFGNPDFRGDFPADPAALSRAIPPSDAGQTTLTDALRRLSPLPGTARELRDIAALFPVGQAAIFTGADATETAVKSAELGQATIISFATHGLITGDIKGLAEPALALSPPDTASTLDDGLLTASEASELKLNADWVILSACNTAAGDGTPGGEGLSGLARAFLFAGARAILVSHWPVRDDVAAILTQSTLARLQVDPAMGKSQALRHAMLELIDRPRDQTRDSGLSHPSAWAPFVLVGDGGAAR
ncbi:CHAT domain-containing protein [Pelagimonas varians]|uniref:CHAT domain protein n=1 Tax=Pelagimonas varians TaxID=696760 RepID=A0A238L1B1_9RHOB|nr:CHAT domain-containing protein [Pelagimonas varians]PYG27181.1 CHAT domain-containing protein [Pelagimonas varians]SMX48777.1 CHAT domain protein [Pelagimonas varians]